MNATDRFFSPDYRTARERFRETAVRAGARIDSLPLAARCPHGEDLGIDIAWFGSASPRRVLVHSTGLHGVEGFAGSAAQLQWLTGGVSPPPDDGAIAIVHLLNPYGAAWLRRVNENNIDLNRNFGAFDGKPDAAREFPQLDALLNPRSPPRADAFYARAALLVLRHGMTRLRDAVIGGQSENERGLFYRGKRREAGPAAYETFLALRLARAESIVVIDVHTGYGRYAEDTLMVDASPEVEAMRKAFGVHVEVTDGRSTAYRVDGSQQELFRRIAPAAQLYFATQEFGTLHALRVLAALRAENRWHHYGDGTFEHPARRALLDAFCPRDPAWRTRVMARACAAIAQARMLAFGPS